jgi:hypothetical protein
MLTVTFARDTASWTTTLIAAWGAALATFGFLRDHWRTRGRARVRVGYTAGGGQATTQPFVLTATISNHGREPIFLARAAFDTGRVAVSSSQFDTATPLPVELKPGQSYTAVFDAQLVWATSPNAPFREVRVLFYDQLGRSYVSDSVPMGEPRQVATGWELNPVERPTLGQRLRARLPRRRAARPGRPARP